MRQILRKPHGPVSLLHFIQLQNGFGLGQKKRLHSDLKFKGLLQCKHFQCVPATGDYLFLCICVSTPILVTSLKSSRCSAEHASHILQEELLLQNKERNGLKVSFQAA